MDAIVAIIFDLQPENDLELKAIYCICGGEGIYNAVKVFEKEENRVELATNFLIRLNDLANINDLLG